MNNADSISTVTGNDTAPVSFNYITERDELEKLISSWQTEKTAVEDRRKIRENKRNVEEERQRKLILEDETIIPDRTINQNIKQGRNAYLDYITKAKRMLIITDVDNPDYSIEQLELWFTRGMRYPKWKEPWIRMVDCIHVHGGCGMEVMFDPSKPLHCSVDYIPRECLIYPRKTKNLQAVPRLIRCYELTTLQLEEYQSKYSLDEKICKDLIDKFRKRDDFINIYRVLFKKDGLVYNAWHASDNNNDWLRAPVQHDIGLFDIPLETLKAPGPDGIPLFMSPMFATMKESIARPAPLKEYPIYWISYEMTENLELLQGASRTSLDLHVQEALTELYTNTVNTTTRASRLYGSAEDEPGANPELRELGPIKHGVVMNRGVKIFQFPWPNNIILSVIQALGLSNAQEAGHSDFAAMARKDANKTKYEMQMGQEKSQDIVSTDMDIFSSPVLDVQVLCFNIARHQAAFGLIKAPTDPLLLFGDYNCQPAGDIEVVKRVEDKQNAEQFFNIARGTPLAEKLMVFLIERFFPDQADKLIASLSEPNKDAIIEQLIQIIEQIPQDELNLEQQSALGNVIATARSMVAQPSNGAPNSAPGGAQAGPPSQSNAGTQTTGQPAPSQSALGTS
jgi:hypothetical protein